MHVTPSFVESVLSAYPFALLIIRDEHLTDESELKKISRLIVQFYTQWAVHLHLQRLQPNWGMKTTVQQRDLLIIP